MWETREEVKSLLKELGVSQAAVIRVLNAQSVYRVTPAEFSSALSGTLATPKANRILADAYTYLDKQKRKEALSRLK